jgi:hypothetical protein
MEHSLVCNFSDESVKTNLTKITRKTTLLKRLTGGEKIRAEKKKGKVYSYKPSALVSLQTNDVVSLCNSSANYGPMKRRFAVFNMEGVNRRENYEVNIVDRLKNTEGVVMLMMAYSLLPRIKDLQKYITTFDIETELLDAKEFNVYESQVDPYLAFLSEAFLPIEEGDIGVNLTIGEVFGLFVQYMIFRKGSTLEIYDYEQLIVDIHSYMNNLGNHTMSNSFFKNISQMFPDDSEAIPTISTFLHRMKTCFNTRLPFLKKELKMT